MKCEQAIHLEVPRKFTNMRNTQTVLGGKLNGRDDQANLDIDGKAVFKQILKNENFGMQEYQVPDLIKLAQDRFQYLGLVNVIMNIRGFIK